MADPTRVKDPSKEIVTRPKKIRSDPGTNTGDSQTISSDKDKSIFRKAKIEIDYENPDDVWKEHTKRRLVPN